MGWKVEQWMKDVFPGEDKIYSEYRSLPRRELAVVAAAVLDSALIELLSKRLAGPESEIHGLLGINGDGRAPCGSFGARIQLALLTSVISENDATTLRIIKNIRNRFAHEVRSDFNSPSVLPLIIKLHDQFVLQSNLLIDAGHLSGPRHPMDVIRPLLSTIPEAGAGLFLSVFCTYQAYFRSLFEKVQPIEAMSTSPRV